MFSTDGNLLREGSGVRARVERYAALGYDIWVVLFSLRPLAAFDLGTNLRVYPVSARLKPLAFVKAFFLAARLARGADIVTSQDAFEVGLLALFVSRIRDCVFHVQIHVDFTSSYYRSESLRQRIQTMIAPFVLRRADGVRAVSKKIASYVVGTLGVPADRVTAVPVLVNTRAVRETPVTIDLHRLYPQFDRIFLVASRFVKQKNIPLAIEAFEGFSGVHPRTGLVIIGSGGEEGTIKRMIAERGLGGQVIVEHFTDAFASCMKTCDVFMLTSDYEGWPMSVAEAAACGKPIIMTYAGRSSEFIEDGVDGLLVPHRDPAALKAAMERMYSEPGLASMLARNAAAKALTYMTVAENDALVQTSWDKALGVRRPRA